MNNRKALMALGLGLMQFALMGISECDSSEPAAYERTVIGYQDVNLIYEGGVFKAEGTLTLAASAEEGLATNNGDAVVTEAWYNDQPVTVTASGDYVEFAGLPMSGSELDFDVKWNFGLSDAWNGASLMAHPDYGYSSLQLTIWSEAGANVGPFQIDGYSRPDGAVTFEWGSITGLEGLFGGKTPVIVKGGSRGSTGVAGYASFGLVASPDYKLYNVGTTAGGVVVSNYHFASDPEQPGKAVYHNKYVIPYIEWLERNVGTYPRRDYVSTSVLLNTGGCMEVDGCTQCDNINDGDASWYSGCHEPGHVCFGSRIRTYDPIVQWANEGQVVSTNTAFLHDDGDPEDYALIVDFLCDMVPYSAQYERNKVVWPVGEEGQHSLSEMTMYASYYRAGMTSHIMAMQLGYDGFARGTQLFVERKLNSTFEAEDYLQAMADGYGVDYDVVYSHYAEWLQVPNSEIPAEYYDYCPDGGRTWKTRGRAYWLARGIDPRVHPSLPEFALQ